MSRLTPLNFKKWIDENRHLLKPPIGNAVVYNDAEFMIMVVGGPNARSDYHIDPAEEFFYQLEGDMVLKVVEDGEFRDIEIKEGDIFLLPPFVPTPLNAFQTPLASSSNENESQKKSTAFAGTATNAATFCTKKRSPSKTSPKIYSPSWNGTATTMTTRNVTNAVTSHQKSRTS